MKKEQVRKRVGELFPIYRDADDQLGRQIFNTLCLAYIEGKLDQASEDMRTELKRMQR